MKQIFLTILLSIIYASSLFAQTVDETKLTAAEIREAQQLAAKFYNRLAENQDVEPLIKEFFIRDFSKRLKFCRITGKCRGFAKDFWAEDETLRKLKASASDFQRTYIFTINYFYLIGRISYHYKILNPNLGDDFEKPLFDEIKKQLNPKADLLKYGFFGADEQGNEPEVNWKTLNDFYKYSNKTEELNRRLQKIETKFLAKVKAKKPKAKLRFLPNDFRIDVENNTELFFNFPLNAKIIEIWSEDYTNNMMLLFKMDLIKENGKLKIIAIYPPMD